VLAATPEQAEAKVPSKRDEIAAKIYRQEQRRLKRRTEAETLLEKQKQAETTTALAKKGEL
jgi:hypothetical protein